MHSHDVRHLRICGGCSELDDMREMIPYEDTFWHGGCFVTEYGEDRLVALPKSHIAVLRLDDIGSDLMRRVLDSHYPSSAGAKDP